MSIYVAFDGPMDQYFMTHPRHLFDKPIEAVHVSPLFRVGAVCRTVECKSRTPAVR